MKKLGVYLTFSGNCEEALNFYKESLGGEIKFRQTFGEANSGMPVDDNYKSKIIHSEFAAEGITFMASDSMPGHKVTGGDIITLNIMFTDEKEQEKIFNNLSKGGKVNLPLQDTFWGARFGMLTDKFGVNWMMNCDKKNN